jgi:hypothetical protein
MIAHEHERVQPPPRPLAGLSQRPNKRCPILVAPHDWFAAIATIKHMINRSGELDPNLKTTPPA